MNQLFRLKTWGLSLCLVAGLAACKAGDTDIKQTDTNETKEPGPAATTTPPASPVELTAEGDLQSVDLEAMPSGSFHFLPVQGSRECRMRKVLRRKRGAV